MRKLILFAALLVTSLQTAAALDKNDVEYSRPNGKPLLLDIHTPEGPGPFPAAIVVHGGGFDQGTKRSYVPALLEVLTKANYAWFSIDYRLAPEAHFPQPVEDVNNAVRWVKEHAAEYHINPAKLALIGESAGAYLTTYAVTHDTPDTHVPASVHFYAPSNYRLLAELRRDHPERFEMTSANRHLANGGGIRFFQVQQLDAAGIATLNKVSPITAVHKGMAPMLLIHGTLDDQLAYELSPALCSAMTKLGNKCDLITIEGGKHGMGGWDKAPEMQHWKQELPAWLNKTLR